MGLEIYLQFPALDHSNKTESMMIYAEGIFGSDFQTDYAYEIQDNGSSIQYNQKVKIKEDSYLTLRDIKEKGNTLSFALDGMVMDSVPLLRGDGGQNYAVKPYLYKHLYPEIVSAVTETSNTNKSLLYPRESISYWLDYTRNPFISVWYKQHATGMSPNKGDDTISQDLCDMFVKYVTNSISKTPTNFVKVDERISLRAEIYPLKMVNGSPETK